MLELARDPIFQTMPSEALFEVAHHLSFKPIFSEKPLRYVKLLHREEQLRWFDTHRLQIEDEVCRLGSWTLGETKTYARIVRDLAKKLRVKHPASADTAAIERAILASLWNDTIAQLTSEQIAKLKTKASEMAASQGKNLSTELAGFAVITGAQLSGFGVYLLGSTLLGAVNGALGLGLGFGAFTGLSSAISTMIGPAGWALLGLATLVKLGAPNYKKILPIVILVAIHRPTTPSKPFWKKPGLIVCLLVLVAIIWVFVLR
jgi:uncharacterized protein YaaW (UPF0174 family)